MPKFTLYHESNHDFGFPDLDAMRAAEGGKDNGCLGLWTSVLNGPPRGDGLFGTNLYQANVACTEAEIRVLPLPELRQFQHEHLEDSREAFITWRDQLLSEGYKLAVVVEVNHTVKQAIILDLSIIQTFIKKDRVP